MNLFSELEAKVSGLSRLLDKGLILEAQFAPWHARLIAAQGTEASNERRTGREEN